MRARCEDPNAAAAHLYCWEASPSRKIGREGAPRGLFEAWLELGKALGDDPGISCPRQHGRRDLPARDAGPPRRHSSPALAMLSRRS